MGYDMKYVRKPDGEVERVTAASAAFDAACAARGELPPEEKGTINMDRARASDDIDSDDNYDGRSDRYRAAQEVVHAAYKAVRDADTSYFRLNIFGMSEYARLMEAFGMIDESGGDYPKWPDAGDYGMENDEWERVEYPEYFEDSPPLSDPMRSAAERYLADRKAVQSWHEEGTPAVIPGHKFSTNDGWICTPDECTASVAAWTEACREAGAGDIDLGRKVLTEAMDEHSMSGAYWMKWITYIERAAEYGGFEVHKT